MRDSNQLLVYFDELGWYVMEISSGHIKNFFLFNDKTRRRIVRLEYGRVTPDSAIFTANEEYFSNIDTAIRHIDIMLYRASKQPFIHVEG